MPSHVGSYDRKRDPDNFLHLFEGAIRMQKWLMPVASSKRDSRRRTWQFTASNKEKAIVSELSPLGPVGCIFRGKVLGHWRNSFGDHDRRTAPPLQEERSPNSSHKV
ncbi:hypothetical protein Tco_1335520 [Tanacetum coccineum]